MAGIITKDMKIVEAIALCSNAAEIFERHGMGCLICMAASSETIEDGAMAHDIDVQALVDELNVDCAGDGGESA